MQPNQTVMIHGTVFTLRFSYNEQRNHRNVEPRSLSTPKEQGGQSMRLHCPLRGFIMVQLLCAQSSPTTTLLAHLTSSQITHCPFWAGFAFPLHWGGGNRYCSQISAPAFSGVRWTTTKCCPQPAPLTAQPDVTEASRSHLLSKPEQHRLGSRSTPSLGVPAVHRQAAPCTSKLQKNSWGPPEKDETEDHSSAVFGT